MRLVRTAALSVMFLAACVVSAPLVYGQELRIRSVSVTGLTGDNLVAAQRVLRARPGDAYSEKTLQDDCMALLNLPFVENARASQVTTAEGVDVTYNVTAKGRVTGVRFTGNKKFKEKKLLREAKLEDFKDYDLARLTEARDLIVEKYKKEGYLFAKVDFSSRPDGSVLFRIDEGPRLKVAVVNILGNAAFTDAVLKKQLKTKTHRWLILPYRFDENVAGDDRLYLQEYYRDRGYLDATVSISLNLTRNRKGIIVDFVVNEGRLYTVRSATISGNTIVATDKLEAALKMKTGTPFSTPRLNDDVRALKLVCGSGGYIDSSVVPSPVFAENTPEVDVAYRVSEGAPIEVGEIEIVGNERTRDNVIRRELEFFPGERYNLEKLELSRRNLRRLSYFSRVEVTPDAAPAGTTPRNATVSVEEASTGKFTVGVGVSSNSGLQGTISFEQRNFDYRRPPTSFRDIYEGRAWTGGGQTFELDAMPGTVVSQLRVRYYDPRVNDSDYSLGLEFHLWQRERNTYTERRTGPDISVGSRLEKYGFWEAGILADTVRISSIDDDAPPEVESLHGTSQVDVLRYTIGHDTRDNFFMPTEGHRLSTTLEGSHSAIGSDFDFARLHLDGSWYRTLSRDKLDRPFVLSWRGHITDMFASGIKNAPIFERLFVGGAYDLRGFDYRGVGPRYGHEPLGGKFSATGGVEYDFPLAADFLRGAIFYDAGTLATRPGDLSLGDVRQSVGIGVRFIIPAPINMPVSLDFGFAVKKDSRDETQLISFTIGRNL